MAYSKITFKSTVFVSMDISNMVPTLWEIKRRGMHKACLLTHRALSIHRCGFLCVKVAIAATSYPCMQKSAKAQRGWASSLMLLPGAW